MSFPVLVAITLLSNIDALLLQEPVESQKLPPWMKSKPSPEEAAQYFFGEAVSAKGAPTDKKFFINTEKGELADWMKRKPTKTETLAAGMNMHHDKELPDWMSYKPSTHDIVEWLLPPKSSITPPYVRPGTGEPLKSGDRFALESEVVPGKFVSAGKAGFMGLKDQWNEYKHITKSGFGLKPNITKQSTFSFQNAHQSEIKSSDHIKWVQDNQQIDYLLAFDNLNGGAPGFGWPHPLVKKPLLKSEKPDFIIELAREIHDWDNAFGQPGCYGNDGKEGHKGWGWAETWAIDPNEGKVIRDGDSVWIKHPPDGEMDTHGRWYYMTGDPAEGGHVNLPHHYPGFDGHIKNYKDDKWLNVNDPHATSSRFTIRKV